MRIFRRSIVLLQHLASSLSVNGCTVRRLRANYYRIKELCIKLVTETSIYYDARSEKHKNISPYLSAVGIATRRRLHGPRIEFQWG